MAPEQIEGKPADGQADQYALACAAFELLTGVPPSVTTSQAVIYAHRQPSPPLTRGGPTCPGRGQVFARALAKTRRSGSAAARRSPLR